MNCFIVGGAVRDALLGLPVSDRDWVVVGATPEEMARQGFRPVGRDFPVFLHPKTGEEYALARTERKSGRGYRGFTIHASPSVTLEEDLRRRDLTINAMARTAEGALVDPFGGERDLRDGVLRHVSEAFAEDPVRILRVARFAARFDFRVAPETMALMRAMVASGETDHLVPERVWQEFSRGLCEKHPTRLFGVLGDCGYAERHLGDLDRPGDPRAARLERAARSGAALEVRFALLFAGREPRAPERAARFADAVKATNDCAELAALACALVPFASTQGRRSAAELLAALRRADALRRPARFDSLLAVVRLADKPPPTAMLALLGTALAAARGVDAAAIARDCDSPAEIPVRIEAARVRAIDAALMALP